MNKLIERLKNGIITENPIFVQVLAMCPTLAVTTGVENALGMGLASTVVLIFSNMLISMVRKLIPEEIRIPAYIVIIATFVTVVDMLIQGYIPALYASLGIFIPLIVVNCVILGRAEAYAAKNKVLPSIFDAIGMGIGFTVALISLAVFRELLGSGKIMGIKIMPEFFNPASIMILAPGAFFTLGGLMTLLNYNKMKKAKAQGKAHLPISLNCGSCSGCGTGSCDSDDSIKLEKKEDK